MFDLSSYTRLYLKIISVFIVLFTAASFYLYFDVVGDAPRKSDVVRVIFDENGFSPNNIEIVVGQSVLFINKSGRDFWPASDFHPTHSLYPSFDPGVRIGSGSNWMFNFSNPGNWTYHDHLHPQYAGYVSVNSVDGAELSEPNFLYTDCLGLDDVGEKGRCWSYNIDRFVKGNRLNDALNFVKTTFDEDVYFSNVCHDYMHSIGYAAYDLRKTVNLRMYPWIDYCGYGFFHGFVEHIIANVSNYKFVSEFCNSYSKINSVLYACYHGVGHGIISVVDGEGDDALLMGLDICKALSRSKYLVNQCASGLFMETAGYMISDYYNKGFDIYEKNPLIICGIVSEFDNVCYSQMYPVLFKVFGRDILAVSRYISFLDGDNAKVVMENFSATIFDPSEPEQYIAACKSIIGELQQYCMNGFPVKLISISSGNPYHRAVTFCTLVLTDLRDSENCLDFILKYAIKIDGGVEKLLWVCEDSSVFKNSFYLCSRIKAIAL